MTPSGQFGCGEGVEREQLLEWTKEEFHMI